MTVNSKKVRSPGARAVVVCTFLEAALPQLTTSQRA
jgi:hypothetical protein